MGRHLTRAATQDGWSSGIQRQKYTQQERMKGLSHLQTSGRFGEWGAAEPKPSPAPVLGTEILWLLSHPYLGPQLYRCTHSGTRLPEPSFPGSQPTQGQQLPDPPAAGVPGAWPPAPGTPRKALTWAEQRVFRVCPALPASMLA